MNPLGIPHQIKGLSQGLAGLAGLAGPVESPLNQGGFYVYGPSNQGAFPRAAQPWLSLAGPRSLSLYSPA